MKLFKRKGNRLIAAVLAAALLITSLVIGLSGTFAAKPDKQVRLVQPNSNPVLAHGAVFEFNTSGVNSVSLVDTTLGTASISNAAKSNARTTLNLNGSKTAGVAAVMRGSAIGTVGVTSFQVVDPSNIAGYNLPNGGNGYIKEPRPGTPLSQSDLGIKYYKIGNPATPTGAAETNSNTLTYVLDNSLVSKVTWESLNWEVIDSALRPVGKGSTILLGTFTDRWGVKQTIAYLFGVGVVPNDSAMNDLLDAINKGKEILADADANEGKYDPDKLSDLDDAVKNGIAVLEDSSSTNNDYKDAAKDIWDAIDALKELPPVDTGYIPGPDKDGDGKPDYWYRPVGRPPHIFEVVDKDKNSKYPPEYVYNPGDKPGDGNDKPAYGPKDGAFWVEDPNNPNIYVPVDSDGNLKDKPAIWGGPDGKWGGEDDTPAVKGNNGAYYVSWGQNIFQKVNKTGPNAGQLDNNALIGGGPDKTPGTSDDLESRIFLNLNDDKYYAGPFSDEDGDDYYIGDVRPRVDGVTTGGSSSDKKVPTDPIDSTDQIYYLAEDGSMVTVKPGTENGVIVTVAPPYFNVLKGEAKKFEATVKGASNTAVTWSIEGGPTSVNTVISSSGNLTIGSDESAVVLFVIATSVADPNASDMAVVLVGAPKPIVDTPVGGDYVDDKGVIWTVIAEKNGKKLLITKQVYEVGTDYNNKNIYTLFEQSNLFGIMQNWFVTNAGSDVKGMALNYEYQTAAGAPINKGQVGAGIEYDWVGSFLSSNWNVKYNLERAITNPGNASGGASGKAFALSISEANRYFANDAARKAKDVKGKNRAWWLRSPGKNTCCVCSVITDAGNVHCYDAVSTSRGFRPAVWVTTN